MLVFQIPSLLSTMDPNPCGADVFCSIKELESHLKDIPTWWSPALERTVDSEPHLGVPSWMWQGQVPVYPGTGAWILAKSCPWRWRHIAGTQKIKTGAIVEGVKKNKTTLVFKSFHYKPRNSSVMQEGGKDTWKWGRKPSQSMGGGEVVTEADPLFSNLLWLCRHLIGALYRCNLTVTFPELEAM